MKWIVIEENPKPDQYIAVLPASADRPTPLSHSVHTNISAAIERARQLRDKYRLSSIRLFQPDSHSISLRD
ncbi:MAG: hypothetical protein MUC38_11050 [Cyclobacteriaceae bacterium]|jgi:hypothetical protein|nr:hypothetical protein [Cyclobacteriaceae bacterium]